MDRGASEIALIEKIGAELSVALEGISAISIRAQQMDFDPALVEHFQRIRSSTESALGAIGDLVDFSQIEGGIELHPAAFGLRAADNKVHVHDLHATILHLLGLDHEALTYLHNGRYERLTDVAGRVVTEILA